MRPRFSAQSSDGDIWPLLLEKVWAKLNGNYDYTNSGYIYEGFLLLGGSPTDIYTINDRSSVN